MSERKVTRLVFVCGGAADVGELTDRAARQLTREGTATLSCLASIAARDDDITFNAQLADQVLLIDGCPSACARRAFKLAGLHRFSHFDLREIGLLKGDTPVTPGNIQRVVDQAVAMFDAASPDARQVP
jgi:uncharacterized metal-binding protein